ncbi:2-oxo acid dehydrogenase subunit E2 [Pseudaminobacter sp. 19-2017]|uniref:Dihydrolipoamide acetyltransferase component of pyruvate dehydrogenase complex n=1 Tax=Pseudaminobacter soli (ex Zhang et al. 2022) TaxID=2831468 RepID=A0A942DYF5_9HYPH|nr:dihydrolipoamide acetyltransferase family protein [Pseudaminobacter soli]MBS3649906.1 2-oxo acid dehydrogenase subunit E2 [Pseudaminobacter soli]
MPEHVIKLPDVGEGVAEAELVEWHVKVGDLVREDSVLAAVMTDKATVEIPSPVDGEVIWLGAEIGQSVPVGSPIVRLKVGAAGSTGRDAPMDDGEDKAPLADGMSEEGEHIPPPPEATELAVKVSGHASGAAAAAAALRSDTVTTTEIRGGIGAGAGPSAGAGTSARLSAHTSAGIRAAAISARPEGARPTARIADGKPLASPAVRLRAKEGGIDLRQVPGTGPAGRITHEDLDVFLRRGPAPTARPHLAADTSVEEIKIVGLRRRIAEKMALAWSRIPHITYVEEVDVTALEELREKLNREDRPGRPKLTVLPFLMRAMVKAIREQPIVNSHFDDASGVIHRFGGVHIGIATQTPSGLMVPVVRHAEARDLFDCASELTRLSEAAKAGTATREELSGSTITITSLGALGGIATTPIINHPEVAIVGVNKIVVRPIWDGSQFVPRKMMNLSSSFDHRVVDGWNAAVFVQRIKALLETPALIFVED